MAIVDGYKGELIINPDEEQVKEAKRVMEEENEK